MAHRQRTAHDLLGNATAILVFAGSFLTYLLTTAPTASFWDCPEYIATAYGLEPGHPPGNPLWMLVARIAACFASSPQTVAFAVNITSGIFTALAATFLYLTILAFCRYLRGGNSSGFDIFAALAGAFVFAWCDSAWFSAVEAEVYAMSVFFTALSTWIAVKVFMAEGETALSPRGQATIILLAYLCGLTVGVHQLNLLCIPAICLSVLYGGNRRFQPGFLPSLIVLLAGMVMIGLILFGILPGAVWLCGKGELLAVNVLHLPFHSGAIAVYLLLTLLFAWLGIYLRRRRDDLGRIFRLCCWCVVMVLVGFSSYAVIIIRGSANPPLNTGAPADIFAFEAYFARDQYGSHPLLKGPTPFSKKMFREEMGADSTPSYRKYYVDRGAVRHGRLTEGMAPGGPGALLTAEDSAAYFSSSKGYVVTRYLPEFRYTPELDMWLPRIFSPKPDDLEAYKAWTDMTDDNMVEVEVTEAVDADGHNVGRYDPATGKRTNATAKRPSYFHSLQYLAGYQLGYMYLRYLMWNFAGRQNDIPSQGQADAGNFITGIEPLDALMLGPQKTLPPELSAENRGRNVYWLLPLLLGFFGMIWLLVKSPRGRRVFTVVAALWVMTGPAIVVYLNQTPGEPRERDYSFIGAIYASAIFIGMGVPATAAGLRRLKMGENGARTIAATLGLGTAALIFAENLDDHDRSGNFAARDFGYNLLASADDNAILFVDGDNNTFPLWYLREVEGVGADKRIVSVAYLTTNYYIRQLLTQDRASAPIPFTGHPSSYDANGVNSVRYATSGGTRDAVETLQKFYSDRRKSGSSARIEAARLRIAPQVKGADSIIIDLRKLSPGGTLLQRDLVMLDVVATNAATGWKRPLYWVANIADNKKCALGDKMVQRGMLLRLDPLAAAKSKYEPYATARLIRENFSYGGFDAEDASQRYFEEISRHNMQIMRRNLMYAATEMLQRGDTAEAARLAADILAKLPGDALVFTLGTHDMIPYNSGIEAARIFLASKDKNLQKRGKELLLSQIRTSLAWHRYWGSLSERRRAVMSNEMRLRAQSWFYPVQVWLENSLPVKELENLGITTAEIKMEQKTWNLSLSRRHLVSDARKATKSAIATPADTLFARRLRGYLDAGGNIEDLKRFREFDNFPFSLYLFDSQP